MKEKTRTLIIAGSVLVALLAVIILVPGDALDRRESNLSAEQVENENAIIAESLEAISDFEEREEENSRAYYTEYNILGGAYSRLGDHRRAREAFLNAAKYSENPIQDYTDLITLETMNGNYDDARKILVDASNEDPEEFAFWNLLIDLEKEHFGLEGEALGDKINEAITATERSTGSLVTYAYFLEENGDYAGALECWREAAAQNPDATAVFAPEISRLEALVGQE